VTQAESDYEHAGTPAVRRRQPAGEGQASTVDGC